jgi:hypothetical protein|nr:MAG TPA: hypothetical protein [Caudoviricetes sp.]
MKRAEAIKIAIEALKKQISVSSDTELVKALDKLIGMAEDMTKTSRDVHRISQEKAYNAFANGEEIFLLAKKSYLSVPDTVRNSCTMRRIRLDSSVVVPDCIQQFYGNIRKFERDYHPITYPKDVIFYM